MAKRRGYKDGGKVGQKLKRDDSPIADDVHYAPMMTLTKRLKTGVSAQDNKPIRKMRHGGKVRGR